MSILRQLVLKLLKFLLYEASPFLIKLPCQRTHILSVIVVGEKR